MNSLQQFLAENDLDETTALNRLQDFGVISDLCVSAADVADQERAINFLEIEMIS